MGDPLKLPPSFKQCDSQTCPEKKHPKYPEHGKEIEVKTEYQCEQDGKQCSGKCYCQLFSRPSGAGHDKDEWKFVATDPTGAAKMEGGLEYLCVCVSPVLPEGFILCGGGCTLQTGGENDYKQVHCDEGPCGSEDGAKCLLFRIKKPVANDAGGTWEFQGKTFIKPLDHYYYRCFCVKQKPQ